GKRPVSIGFFFSLGHSTIVVVASMIVYTTASAAERQMGVIREFSGLFGTSISAVFLIAIAIINIVILRSIWSTFQKVREGGVYNDQSTYMLVGGGILGRVFRPLFRSLSAPWQMYPIGLLFGLGFDTATEVALLGISAAGAAKGLSVVAMAVFPVLFTAGMTLIDTTDGILLVGANSGVFIKPLTQFL